MGSINPDFLILSSCNSLVIREIILSIKLLCKHVNSCVQMQTQPIAQFIFHECKHEKVHSSSTHASTNTIVISTNFKYSLNR
jgi:hypothetical protein